MQTLNVDGPCKNSPRRVGAAIVARPDALAVSSRDDMTLVISCSGHSEASLGRRTLLHRQEQAGRGKSKEGCIRRSMHFNFLPLRPWEQLSVVIAYGHMAQASLSVDKASRLGNGLS